MCARICTIFTLMALALPVYAETTKSGIPTPGSAVTKPLPESVDDLKEIQKQTQAVLEKAIPCTVGLRIGGASGSGVIINKEGIVLTAGHVSGEPGQKVDIILADGKIIKGKTLGCNRGIDSGMIQITDKGDFPYLEMGKSSDLKRGQWCIAIGHPNGYIKGRTPVVRLGRILKIAKDGVETDCTLVGGDSGGPLFDMEGRVIAIHSRIGSTLTSNTHVPIDTYHETWDRLVKAESWGGTLFNGPPRQTSNGAYLGVSPARNSQEAQIEYVTEDSPAAKAGLRPGDIIKKFDGKDIKTYNDFVDLLNKKKPDDEVAVEVKRGDKMETIKVKLGKR
jgi:serine protease Do